MNLVVRALFKILRVVGVVSFRERSLATNNVYRIHLYEYFYVLTRIVFKTVKLRLNLTSVDVVVIIQDH